MFVLLFIHFEVTPTNSRPPQTQSVLGELVQQIVILVVIIVVVPLMQLQFLFPCLRHPLIVGQQWSIAFFAS